ncbi:uncharacterized protein LOC133778034 [Humulus lupulus]|uniref:uncharacterized protein LOC133778034 n=1 Tax=Humulus lupulus TaxID=3486 RepID=UPI002B401A32|nr:uncharacterized protein LOC133778034 [Humulus lupulus]
MDQTYVKWIWHGEEYDSNNKVPNERKQFDQVFDDPIEMVRDADEYFVDKPEEFLKFLEDADKPIFSGAPLSKLVVLVKLYNLKAGSGWSDTSFTKLLTLLKEILPKDNELPSSLYEAKKTLCTLGMEYSKIHACPNDCILYRNQYESATECPVCKTSRWKKNKNNKECKKGIPAKVLWYLPPIPRFIRLFRNPEHAESPKQPGNDIDIYLAPLIDDLKVLWNEIDCYDSFKKENFILRGVLLWTINDFPAYGSLSGCFVKGYKGCPICGEQTSATRLEHCRKMCYMGHRRFLPEKHYYRKQKLAFNGEQELREAPTPMTGEAIYEEIRFVENKFGKPVEKVDENVETKGKKKGKCKTNIKRKRNKKDQLAEDSKNTTCWKKMSILFELEYWRHLLVRHNLDVMHIEKNICDSLIETLLNIPGKNKDIISARKDLVLMFESKKDLAPETGERRTYLPPTCYTLKKDEKCKLCETLANVKVPDGYSSNIRNLVSLKDCRLISLKSHDCHVLMQQLLPIAIRGSLDKHVRNAIIRMCLFFNAICCKVVDVSKLDKIQIEISKTLCLFEQYFPPSFFDIMVHLAVHLVREVKLCGPGCIVEAYIAEEAVEFCTEYITDGEAIGIPRKTMSEDVIGRGINNGRLTLIKKEDWDVAHRNILENTIEVQAYIEEHLEYLHRENRSKSRKWIQDYHHRAFHQWFRDRIQSELSMEFHKVSENLRWISLGPTTMAIKHDGFVVNGYRFSTKARDDVRVTQNSGVCIVTKTLQFASARDKKPFYGDMQFYGVIEEIWELDYRDFRMAMFKSNWVEDK